MQACSPVNMIRNEVTYKLWPAHRFIDLWSGMMCALEVMPEAYTSMTNAQLWTSSVLNQNALFAKFSYSHIFMQLECRLCMKYVHCLSHPRVCNAPWSECRDRCLISKVNLLKPVNYSCEAHSHACPHTILHTLVSSHLLGIEVTHVISQQANVS